MHYPMYDCMIPHGQRVKSPSPVPAKTGGVASFSNFAKSSSGVVWCSFWESSSPVGSMKRSSVLDCRRVSKVVFLGIKDSAHLRYLILCRMPPSLHNNVNLQFLTVDGRVDISSDILKMPKLKCIRGNPIILNRDCDATQTSKLEYLSELRIPIQKDMEMLKCLPYLGKLKLECDEMAHFDFDLDFQFLSQLESLRLVWWRWGHEWTMIKFPQSIRKINLCGLRLPWERMPRIGALPNLQVLKLGYSAFVGERWETSDGEFLQLRILKLHDLDLVQWNVSSAQHFPRLQQLSLRRCWHLVEIPSEIGEVETLQLIEVCSISCQKSVVESAIRISEEQIGFGNEELRVDIRTMVKGCNTMEADILHTW